jgi:hypothetical protein
MRNPPQPDRVWSLRDQVVCDGRDPEGNIIQLLSPVAARPG